MTPKITGLNPSQVDNTKIPPQKMHKNNIRHSILFVII